MRIGTDAALALAMCKVIIDEGLYNKQFVQEQTDLPLLVRTDTGASCAAPRSTMGDRDDQFFWYDSESRQAVPAPRGTLAMGDVDPALEGTFKVKLANGTEVEVRARLRAAHRVARRTTRRRRPPRSARSTPT